MGIFKKKTTTIDRARPVPRHVGIILDGNGRWAQKRGLPRTAGHAAGSENFRRIATYCREIGMDYLTVYAFSTENWKRSAEEVGAIMGLLKQYLLEALEKMERDHIRLRFLGDLTRVPQELQDLAERTKETSTHYQGFQANICLNYGGRDEIVRAARAFAAQCAAGEAKAEDLTEAGFSGLLDSAGLPDPDLIIRTSGELRLSNFLLWQAAYSELYVTPTLWPDFTPEELEKAIADFNRRTRRFGGVQS